MVESIHQKLISSGSDVEAGRSAMLLPNAATYCAKPWPAHSGAARMAQADPWPMNVPIP
jgi:hypothetical protein